MERRTCKDVGSIRRINDFQIRGITTPIGVYKNERDLYTAQLFNKYTPLREDSREMWKDVQFNISLERNFVRNKKTSQEMWYGLLQVLEYIEAENNLQLNLEKRN